MKQRHYFNRIAAKIFIECYKDFPSPKTMTYKSFLVDDAFDDAEYFKNTLAWLQSNGYIVVTPPVSETEDDYVVSITEKTFIVLGHIAEGNKMATDTLQNTTLVELLEKAHHINGVSAIIRQIFTLGIRLCR